MKHGGSGGWTETSVRRLLLTLLEAAEGRANNETSVTTDQQAGSNS